MKERSTGSVAEPKLVGSNAELRQKVFAFTWALATLIDEARQPISIVEFSIPGLLSITVFGLAAWLLMRPSSNAALLILASFNVCQLALAFPNTTNHSTILGFTNLAIIVTLLYSWVRNRRLSKGALFSAFPVLRLAFLVMYGSAAIAKINSTFLFDLAVSCAPVLAEEELFWLPFKFDYQSMLFLPWLIAGAELLVFSLPMFNRTRYLGIALAVLFHTALSLTANSKGPGFTLVLFALLGLFLSDSAARQGLELVRGVKTWLAKYLDSWFTTSVWFAFLVIQANISFIEGWQGFGWWRWGGTLLVNIIWGSILVFLVVRHRREKLGQRLIGIYGPASIVVLALVLLNSLSPYLGGKTTSTMTMYSNLQVEGGVSNHLIIPRLPIHTPQDDIVTVLRTNDPNLQRVIDLEYKITMHEFVRILSENPEQPIEYIYQGERVLLRHASDNPSLVAYDPIWHKLIGHRKITDKCVW